MDTLIPPLADSALALAVLRLANGDELTISDDECDSLLYVVDGEGVLELDGEHALGPGTAALVLAAEQATQVLFDPCKGSLRATLFVGFIPPARRRGTTTCTTRSSGFPRVPDTSTSGATLKRSAPGPRSGCDLERCTSSRI